MPPRIFEVSREVYPEAHKTAARTFFSVGILLLLMMFCSRAHAERNSTIVGGGAVVKSVKIRSLCLINELYQDSFTNASENRVKLVFGCC